MRPLLLTALLAACASSRDDTGPEAPAYMPDLFCPGDPSGACDDADGPLLAGAAVLSIVPACWEAWEDLDGDHLWKRNVEPFHDCGCDRLCPDDPGYPGADEGEGDGVFQAIWIAGFDHARAMNGVRDASLGLSGDGDGLWARTVVLRQGQSTVAIVALDAFGLFHDEALLIRELAADLDVDHILVHATHDHEAPDSMGIYGPSLLKTGYDARYMAQLRETAVASIRQALDALEPVDRMVIGSADITPYSEKGTRNILNDTRDPYVVDEQIKAARFARADGSTIATLVSWGSHPEARANDNNLLTSDYVHALRKAVEQGVTWAGGSQPGVGGVALFLNSTVGGMMTPLRITVTDPDGNDWASGTWEKVDAVGLIAGGIALDALEAGEEVPDPRLSFRKKLYHLRVENIALQAMLLNGVISRSAYNYDPSLPLDDDNVPEVLTEANVVEIGPLQLATVPGEMLPELALGGYDGSHVNAPGVELVRASNDNPPDLSLAPGPPYLYDHFTRPHRWLVGLGNDEIGYIIPSYDFQIDAALPYIRQPDGDHYEETNSVGPETADRVVGELRALLQWQP